jgi:hypothetical protein
MGARNPQLPRSANELSVRAMPAIAELPGLRATVDRVAYMPHLEAPADKPFPFVYFITIHNDFR